MVDKCTGFKVNGNRCDYTATIGNCCSKHYDIYGTDKLQPRYDDNEFDLMIVEIEGIDGQFHGQFCIIPKDVLISQKILKSKTSKGKTTFRICKPDYHKQHWSKVYWNNLTPFMKKKIKLIINKKS